MGPTALSPIIIFGILQIDELNPLRKIHGKTEAVEGESWSGWCLAGDYHQPSSSLASLECL